MKEEPRTEQSVKTFDAEKGKQPWAPTLSRLRIVSKVNACHSVGKVPNRVVVPSLTISSFNRVMFPMHAGRDKVQLPMPDKGE